jgi:hypothetical protein
VSLREACTRIQRRLTDIESSVGLLVEQGSHVSARSRTIQEDIQVRGGGDGWKRKEGPGLI